MIDPTIGLGAGGAGAIGPKPGAGAGMGGSGPDGVGSFQDLLESSIRQVNEMQQASEQAKIGIMTGGVENLSEAMTEIKKAELAFQQLVEIRNKLVDAYQEIMRMQI